MNDPFMTTNGTIVYTKEWKGTIVYGTERSFEHNGMELNDRFNTTERKGTIVSSQRNGYQTPSERKLNGMRGTAVRLHGIQTGTFIDA